MITDPPSDEDLAKLVAQRGTPAAVQSAQVAARELYRRHSPQMLGFLRRRIGEADCEDLHQTVWVRVWERIAVSFRGGSFRDWIFQIARNLIIDWIRRRRGQPIESVPQPVTTAAPYLNLLTAERQAILEGCIGELTERAAELVRARLAGEGYDTLAPRLGLSPAQAHKIWHTAVAQLGPCVERGLS